MENLLFLGVPILKHIRVLSEFPPNITDRPSPMVVSHKEDDEYPNYDFFNVIEIDV